MRPTDLIYYKEDHKDYQRWKKNWEFVDTIDFDPYFDCYDIRELMDNVEDDYYKETPEGVVFNWIDDYELMVFLKRKYNVYFIKYQPEPIYLIRRN